MKRDIYGKFVHVMDPKGNRLKLWEPTDSEFTRLYEEETVRWRVVSNNRSCGRPSDSAQAKFVIETC